MGRESKRGTRGHLRTIAGALLVVVLLPVLIPCFLGWGVRRLVCHVILVWRFRRTLGRQGKIGVLVYSDNPHWKNHVENRILPRVGSRLVTVNWSRRAEWPGRKPLEVRVFEHWAGSRAFNPMAIVVRGYGRVETIRFFAAFKAARHGKPDDLRKAEEQLFRVIEAVWQGDRGLARWRG